MRKVFLGGTYNSSMWRAKMVDELKIPYFNPVVDDWDDAARMREEQAKAECHFRLYVFTPLMTGFFGIAELVRDAIILKKRTIMCVLEHDGGLSFSASQLKSFQAIAEMVDRFGAMVMPSLEAVAQYLNSFYVEIPFHPYCIECLIKRDGPTPLNLGGVRYEFKENDVGDFTCMVQRPDHRKHVLSLKDSFRVYQADKQPTPEFTDEEHDFIREWKSLGDDRYLAYVNAHIARFQRSSLKIRLLARGKWDALIKPKKEHLKLKPEDAARFKQKFPVNMDDDLPQESVRVVPVNEQQDTEIIASGEFDESDNWSADQWEAWYQSWLRRGADTFNEKFISDNEAKLLNCPDHLYDKAKVKWEKLNSGKPWPIESEAEVDL